MNTSTPTPAFPAEWRALRSPPSSGARNMAVDTALLEHARDRRYGVWRTYAWDRQTVSFGRNEAVRSRFSDQSVADAGLTAVRRPTGGRALLHGQEVTYSVTMPTADHLPWQVVYRQVNHVLVLALQALGVDASLVNGSESAPIRPEGPICFDAPAPGEISVGGAKLVGSAVWKERGAYLQHGSILLQNHQSRLHVALNPGARAPALSNAAVTTLEECLPEAPSWTAVADALEGALRGMLENRHAGELSGEPAALDAAAVDRHEIHYRDPMWLWRR